MRILVTGASRGIGRAICLRLAHDVRTDDPLRVAVCGRSHPEELDALVAEIRDLGAEAVPLVGDLADPEVPSRLVADALDAFGGLDAVVSNAGIARPGALIDVEVGDWEHLHDVNVRATWLLAKAAHASLKHSQGTFVTVGSMSGVLPQPGMGAYSVTKAGLIMLTRLIAQEWASDGIRANCVSPGLVHTPMTEEAYADSDFKARREQMVPRSRIADPAQDIAGVVAFLLSPDSGYCTGQNITVDGGLTDSILKLLPRRSV